MLDTGAQMNIIPVHLVTSMGVDMGDLFPVGARIGGPSAKLISILGGVLLEVSGKSRSTGTTHVSQQMLFCVQQGEAHISQPGDVYCPACSPPEVSRFWDIS